MVCCADRRMFSALRFSRWQPSRAPRKASRGTREAPSSVSALCSTPVVTLCMDDVLSYRLWTMNTVVFGSGRSHVHSLRLRSRSSGRRRGASKHEVVARRTDIACALRCDVLPYAVQWLAASARTRMLAVGVVWEPALSVTVAMSCKQEGNFAQQQDPWTEARRCCSTLSDRQDLLVSLTTSHHAYIASASRTPPLRASAAHGISFILPFARVVSSPS